MIPRARVTSSWIRRTRGFSTRDSGRSRFTRGAVSAAGLAAESGNPRTVARRGRSSQEGSPRRPSVRSASESARRCLTASTPRSRRVTAYPRPMASRPTAAGSSGQTTRATRGSASAATGRWRGGPITTIEWACRRTTLTRRTSSRPIGRRPSTAVRRSSIRRPPRRRAVITMTSGSTR